MRANTDRDASKTCMYRQTLKNQTSPEAAQMLTAIRIIAVNVPRHKDQEIKRAVLI